jgi:hypothetical protein
MGISSVWLGKEDNLVKTSLLCVLIAASIVLLPGSGFAWAQQMAQEEMPYPQDEQQPSEQHTPLMEEGQYLIDNGLWEGAEIGPCCAVCGGGSACPPDWYTFHGAKVIGRTKPRGIDIGYVYDGRLTQVLSSRSAAPDISAGYSMTIGHYFLHDRLNNDHFVEFSYWGLNAWQDRAEHRGNGNLYSQFAANNTFHEGFDEVDYQSTYYASYLHNFEISGRINPRGRKDQLVLHPNGKWRRECQPGRYVSYIYGIRYMQLHEVFRFHGQDALNNVGDYDIWTHNNMLGLQIGIDLTFRQCRWAWGVRAKAGPYVNFADQQSSIVAGPFGAPTYNVHLSDSKHEASLIGETGFFATFKFRPNLMGRASYDFMWATGVALAPEQLQFISNPINYVNADGVLFCHGMTLGLEWQW